MASDGGLNRLDVWHANTGMSSLRVLILGSTGLLGQALVREAERLNLYYLGVSTRTSPYAVDVTRTQTLDELIRAFRPTVVINTVALVSLAECENNPGRAYTVNARPLAYLADWANRDGFYLVQVSTDHYFQGDGDKKHMEADPVLLLNEYARTKYAAEQFALTASDALVIRTNIVGFRGWPEQPTFVEWALQSLATQKSMTLFHDYYTSSLDVATCAKAMFQLLQLPKRPKGILNLASRDVSSKEQFVTSLAGKLNYDLACAEIGSVFDFPSPVERAESLGLDVSKAEALLGWRLPSLEEVTTQLATEYQARLQLKQECVQDRSPDFPMERSAP